MIAPEPFSEGDVLSPTKILLTCIALVIAVVVSAVAITVVAARYIG
jgi:hypothetical protein